MKENFTQALTWVLLHEGGWSDHPDDPGGATNQGITLATFRQYYGPGKTRADLRQITPDQVIHIYWAGYWDPCQCDRLPAGVDYAIFDGAVNSGVAQSVNWLQWAGGVAMDGVIGPVTMAAIAGHEPPVLIKKMLNYRLQFLHNLKTWPTFGKGWERRIWQVHRQALSLVRSE